MITFLSKAVCVAVGACEGCVFGSVWGVCWGCVWWGVCVLGRVCVGACVWECVRACVRACRSRRFKDHTLHLLSAQISHALDLHLHQILYSTSEIKY